MRNHGRWIALLLNLNAILWSVAGMVWVLNWDGIFPSREKCADAIVAEVQRTPGVTEIDTPQACRGFDQAEHMEIVASIPWLSLFPNGPETGLGREEIPEWTPEPVRPTRRPEWTPKPKPSPTAEPTQSAEPTKTASPEPKPSKSKAEETLPPITPNPATPIVPSGNPAEPASVEIEPVRAG